MSPPLVSPRSLGRLHGLQARKVSDTPAPPGKPAVDCSPTSPVASAAVDSTITAPQGAGNDRGLTSSGERREIVRASSVLTLDLADVTDDRAAHLKHTCGGIDRCAACNLRATLWAAQGAAARVANVITRDLWQRDAASLDHLLAEHGGQLPPGAWKPPTVERDCYQLAIRCAPELASGIAAAVSHSVWQKWRGSRAAPGVRWRALVRQEISPPHYKRTMPLPIRRQDYRIVARTDGSYLLEFTLRRGFHDTTRRRQCAVPVRPRDAQQERCLVALATGDWRRREMKLEQDRTRPGRWYARIAYSRAVPIIAPEPARWAGINRGICCFVAAVTDQGARRLYDGGDIEAYLRQIQRRRRSYQRDGKMSARWGHGRERTLAPLRLLEAKGDRWRRTKCQTIARRLAEWLRDQGVTHVAYEDFTGIRDGEPEQLRGGRWVWERIQEWPYYELQTRLLACLEELGLHTMQIAPQWISMCPKCGGAAEINLRTRRMKCGPCNVNLPLDIGQAMNVMARGRASGEVVNSSTPTGKAAGTGEKTGMLATRCAGVRKRGGSGGRRGKS